MIMFNYVWSIYFLTLLFDPIFVMFEYSSMKIEDEFFVYLNK